MSPPPTDELSKQGIGIKGGSPDIFEEEPVSGSRRCVDVSLFVHSLAPLQQQGQALVAHYVDKLKALPKEAVRLLAMPWELQRLGKNEGSFGTLWRIVWALHLTLQKEYGQVHSIGGQEVLSGNQWFLELLLVPKLKRCQLQKSRTQENAWCATL